MIIANHKLTYKLLKRRLYKYYDTTYDEKVKLKFIIR